jgi:hypothetical protein
VRRSPLSFVSAQSSMLLLLYVAGKTFGRPPSAWLAPPATTDQPTSVADQVWALDVDLACLTIGLDAEREAHERALAQ